MDLITIRSLQLVFLVENILLLILLFYEKVWRLKVLEILCVIVQDPWLFLFGPRLVVTVIGGGAAKETDTWRIIAGGRTVEVPGKERSNKVVFQITIRGLRKETGKVYLDLGSSASGNKHLEENYDTLNKHSDHIEFKI